MASTDWWVRARFALVPSFACRAHAATKLEGHNPVQRRTLFFVTAARALKYKATDDVCYDGRTDGFVATTDERRRANYRACACRARAARRESARPRAFCYLALYTTQCECEFVSVLCTDHEFLASEYSDHTITNPQALGAKV